MKHFALVSRPSCIPVPAASLLEKALWLSNALDTLEIIREISALLGKEDGSDQ